MIFLRHAIVQKRKGDIERYMASGSVFCFFISFVYRDFNDSFAMFILLL